MADPERIRARLDNIRGIEPILTALKTVSLGTWQTAIHRRSGVESFGQRLVAVRSLLAPHLAEHHKGHIQEMPTSPASSNVIVVIGSERGLCGRYNSVVVDAFEDYLTERAPAGINPELIAMGSRAVRTLTKRGHTPGSVSRLSLTRVPSFELAADLSDSWLARYERYELDTVDLVYNTYRGLGLYKPTVVRLIPPQIPPSKDCIEETDWAAPIIETDPTALHARVVREWTAVALYGHLLDAAAAEHSARYFLLEGATQNMSRLSDELTLVLHIARQQAITTQMQELAAGAGLLGATSMH